MKFMKKNFLIIIFSILATLAFALPGGGPGGGGGGGRPSGGGRSPSGGGSRSSSHSRSLKDDYSSKKTSTESNKTESSSSEVMKYRGNRVLSDGTSFNLQSIKTERNNDSEVTLEITFTESVNPLSVSKNSVVIDGDSISSETKFSFNKKGDTIRLSVPVKNERFSLKIQNVESFDGKTIETFEMKNISDNFGGK